MLEEISIQLSDNISWLQYSGMFCVCVCVCVSVCVCLSVCVVLWLLLFEFSGVRVVLALNGCIPRLILY